MQNDDLRTGTLNHIFKVHQKGQGFSPVKTSVPQKKHHPTAGLSSEICERNSKKKEQRKTQLLFLSPN